MATDLTNNEINKITNHIYSIYQFDFREYAVSSLKRRIERIIDLDSTINTIGDLLEKLNNYNFYTFFIKEITVNTTEFFRDVRFWIELKDIVIPELTQQNNQITIWHAGCSTGQEIISMAILANELGVLDKFNFFATDINTDVLEIAQNRQYHISKIQEINAENYNAMGFANPLKNYYKKINSSTVQFNKSLIQNVSFLKHNLVNDDQFFGMHLILCRNVLIYFNQQLQDTVVNTFYKSLAKNGYFGIGGSESLYSNKHYQKFQPISDYRKIFKRL